MQLSNLSPKSRATVARVAIAALISTQLAACAKSSDSPAATETANKVEAMVGCKSFEESFFNSLYDFPIAGKAFPSATEMRQAFHDSLVAGRMKNSSPADRDRVADTMTELYQILALDAVQQLSANPESHALALETLASLEMGDRTTPEKANLQEVLRQKFEEIEKLATQAGVGACPTPKESGQKDDPTEFPDSKPGRTENDGIASPSSHTLFSLWQVQRHPIVFGGLKTLATAYQSCEVGMKPSMTSSTQDVSGISVVGKHSDGIGSIRNITSLSSLLSTHYYLKDYRKPGGANCFDVKSKPLIYDYGGKPYTTTATGAPLDMFVNSGSGSTKELGIDCSGYVYTAMATAGYKVKSSTSLKSTGVYGVNSRMFMNPQANGLDCLSNAKFTGSSNIKPGDIFASTGHVVLVTYVGTDPFGIDRFTSPTQCTRANIDISRFNFTILQSSPVKGGIGIDRMWARDYFKDSGSMQTGMITHAVSACLAKTRGTTITTTSSYANLVRHSGTAACKGTPIKLSREECVSTCPSSM